VNECGKRPIPCQYCEISLPRERMTEHQEFCGSRTELCHKCSRYVLIRDFQNHEKSCDGSASRSSAALPCEFCCSPIRPDKLDAHQRQCLVERQALQAPLLVEGDDGLFRAIAAGAARTGSHESARTRGGIDQFRYINILTWLRGLGE
ncbi:factor 1, partial [Desmophyllum pertusum]